MTDNKMPQKVNDRSVGAMPQQMAEQAQQRQTNTAVPPSPAPQGRRPLFRS